MSFGGYMAKLKDWELQKKLSYDLYLHKGLSDNYERITKLAIICLRKGIPLMIENPYSSDHYLTRMWAASPKIIDYDRRKNGDKLKKPTQYFFIGIEPQNNFLLEPLKYNESGKDVNHLKAKSPERSEIHPEYAERFIKQYIAKEIDGKYVV